jgi:hypothetical protein
MAPLPAVEPGFYNAVIVGASLRKGRLACPIRPFLATVTNPSLAV